MLDSDVIKMLIQLGTYGPLGIMVIVGFSMYLYERRKTAELTEKLLEYAKASVQADNEHIKGWGALSNLYDLGIKSAEMNQNLINGFSDVRKLLEKLGEEMVKKK